MPYPYRSRLPSGPLCLQPSQLGLFCVQSPYPTSHFASPVANDSHLQLFIHPEDDNNDSKLYLEQAAGIESENLHRRRDPSWVARPRNPFIIFRCTYARTHSNPGKRIRRSPGSPPVEKSLSKRAAEAWHQLPLEEKHKYKILADQEKEEHARLHPNYRFKPTKRNARLAAGSTSSFSSSSIRVSTAAVARNNSADTSSFPESVGTRVLSAPTTTEYFSYTPSITSSSSDVNLNGIGLGHLSRLTHRWVSEPTIGNLNDPCQQSIYPEGSICHPTLPINLISSDSGYCFHGEHRPATPIFQFP